MKQKRKLKTSKALSSIAILEGIVIVSMVILCLVKTDLPIVESILPEQLHGSKEYDVVLDAGHGGFDSGAMDQNLIEKDITLQMSKQIGKILERYGYNVAYIREGNAIDWATDELSDLAYRVEYANQTKAKLLLSIHVNSEEVNSGTCGFEIWGKGSDAIAMRFAERILSNIDTLGYTQNRGFKNQDDAPLYLLENTQFPSLLLEAGFIGSETDAYYLRSGTAQKKFCEQVAMGIIEILQELEVE